MATSKQRGPMAATWWSRRFTEVLESYGLGTRMQRGRRYARSGQVVALEVRTAMIVAQVQGSRPTPYLVTISLPEPTGQQWAKVDRAMTAKVGFVARLLIGEVPPDLEDVFQAAGVALFPQSWQDLRAGCSCPDWENPCKHIAAVLYVFADQLDTDPWLLLAWRGRSREEILDRLRGPARSTATTVEIAPWWPFPPGPLPELSLGGRARAGDEVGPQQSDAVLVTLEPLDVHLGTAVFTRLLGPAYEHIVGYVPDPDPG